MHMEPSPTVRIGAFHAPSVLRRAVAEPPLTSRAEGVDIAHEVVGAGGSHEG